MIIGLLKKAFWVILIYVGFSMAFGGDFFRWVGDQADQLRATTVDKFLNPSNKAGDEKSSKTSR